VLSRSYKSGGNSLFRVFNCFPFGGGAKKNRDNNALLMIPFYFARSVTLKGVDLGSESHKWDSAPGLSQINNFDFKQDHHRKA